MLALRFYKVTHFFKIVEYTKFQDRKDSIKGIKIKLIIFFKIQKEIIKRLDKDKSAF